jgi:hypothetical protein
MHGLPGSDLLTEVLAIAYVAFILFLPLTIGLTLVFSRDLRAGIFYTTAQSINWLIGAGSYYLLPSLGPIYAYPRDFADLPYTRSRGCRARCSTSASSSSPTRRSAPRSTSRPSPRCTSP